VAETSYSPYNYSAAGMKNTAKLYKQQKGCRICVELSFETSSD
jgi:hypothetical protein